MADYVATLKNDLVEQFRGKANIEALMEVIGAQLQQVYDFYDQLRQDRGVHTAVGKQLDGVGDIVVMTRMEAGKLAGDPIPFEVIDDETYRRYLIYKILKNTCDCTYPDIIKAFRMFWDRPLYYKEDPAEPATMIFDTGEMDGTVDTTPLFTTPLLRAAGVTLKLYARTKTEMETAKLYILSGLGFAVTETLLPILERDIDYRAHVYVRGGYPDIGAPNWEIIVAAAAEQIAGAGLILWTCREGELLENALEACARWGLHFDAVNDSLPSWKKFYGNETRKVGATEYWDDKAYRVQNGKLMKEAAHEMA